MKSRISLYPAVCLLLLVPAKAVIAAEIPGQEKTYLHPKIKAKEVSLRKLVILPPSVQVAKQGVKGQEGLGEEAEKATAKFTIEVTAALNERGASVETPFTEEALSANDELKSALADVQRQFDEVAPKMFDKKKDVKKGRFSVGDGVALLNTKGDADAFVIVRAVGAQETNGKTFMKRGLIGLALTHGKTQYRSKVALVDAKNGDVLFLGDYFSWDSPGSKLLEKSFKELPVGAQ
jgi:hypothetical protein